jgi:hypothetical protein
VLCALCFVEPVVTLRTFQTLFTRHQARSTRHRSARSPGEEIFRGVLEAVPEGFFEVAAEDFRNPFDPHEDFGVAVASRGRRSEDGEDVDIDRN